MVKDRNTSRNGVIAECIQLEAAASWHACIAVRLGQRIESYSDVRMRSREHTRVNE